MNRYPLRRLGEVLALDIDEVRILPDGQYNVAGIFSFGRGVFARGPLKAEDTSYTRLYRLREGQVVMSRLKAFEGAIATVEPRFDGWHLSPEFPTYSISSEADSRYIGFLCQWPAFWSCLRKESKGVGARRERVSAHGLLEAEVPLPDLTEQSRLADRLEVLLRSSDAVGHLRGRVSNLLNGLRESLVRAATEDARETVRVGDLLTFDRTPVVIDQNSSYRAVGVKSFGKGFIYHPPVRGEALSKLNYFRFPPGALALSNLMAWEGGITVSRLTDAEYIASNRFFFYSPGGELPTDVSYLRHFFLAQRGRTLLASACSSGAERNRTLGRRRFEALEIPLPPIDEQRRVAQIIDSLGDQLSKVHTDAALTALRPSILNAAFTGQL